MLRIELKIGGRVKSRRRPLLRIAGKRQDFAQIIVS